MKTRIRFLLCLLFLLLCPISSLLAEDRSQSPTPQLSSTSLPERSYVKLEFKNFPISILWRIKKLAPSLKKEVPDDLKVGTKRAKAEGNLIFSYQKQGELVNLKMSLVRAKAQSNTFSASSPSITPLDLKKSIRNPSRDMVTDTLTGFFICFCNTWEKKDMVPVETRTASLETAYNTPTDYPL